MTDQQMAGTRATGTPVRQGDKTARMSSHFMVSHLKCTSCRGMSLCDHENCQDSLSNSSDYVSFWSALLKILQKRQKNSTVGPQLGNWGFIVIQEHCLAVNRHEVESQVPVSLWCRKMVCGRQVWLHEAIEAMQDLDPEVEQIILSQQ